MLATGTLHSNTFGTQEEARFIPSFLPWLTVSGINGQAGDFVGSTSKRVQIHVRRKSSLALNKIGRVENGTHYESTNKSLEKRASNF